MSTPATQRFKRAQQALRQTIQRYQPTLQRPVKDARQGQKIAVQEGMAALSTLEARLAHPTLRIAVFGLVSRGKSAVINALLGEAILPTGPLHGVTRWPRSVYWHPPIELVHAVDELPQLELIDTPGLDEVDGEARGAMAQEVAHQADLILFVVAGDITHTEYDALVTLQAAQKPLLLVFNKIDLYPDTDRQAIYDALTALWRTAASPHPNAALAVDDVVMIAAAPAPLQVRVEWPDGTVTHEWETLPPQMDSLKQALLTIARQDGKALIALNALREADSLETEMARRAIALHQAEAEALIWRFAKYKALAVALNPVAVLDLAGGFITDLAMIRALAKLYGLPITQHEARQLWRAIAKSAGTLILSEIGTGLLLGTGKGAAAVWSWFDSAGGFSALVSVMAAQAGAAGYGTYAVGKAAQVYLEQGCTWGPNGVKAVMQDILQDIDADSAVSRLRQELEAQLMAGSAR
ncbi:MAG TPA: GTP-binding protein [Candidatus Obscuribacterales bacterium]